MQNRLHKKRGFTLLELLVVMVIIGLLVGYVAPMYFKQVGKSEVKTARAQIESFGKALDQYRLDTGHYPTTEQGLAALNVKPADEAKWDGPYLKKGCRPTLGARPTFTSARAPRVNTTSSRSAKTACPAARVKMPT